MSDDREAIVVAPVTSSADVVGLIPAAGYAKRIAPLPCSKELYPIGFHSDSAGHVYPKAVSHYLLEKMRFAGISQAYFVLRPGKWDIPAYFGDGSLLDMHLGYLVLSSSLGVPFTIDHAYPFVRNITVGFGFPDILFGPHDAFAKLLVQQSKTGADAVLGLFRKKQRPSYDLVDFNADGAVRNLILNALDERLAYSWAIAVWTPVFTEFLHDYVNQCRSAAANSPEITAGHSIKTAIELGLRIDSVILSEEPYLDIGTPGDLAEATQRYLPPSARFF